LTTYRREDGDILTKKEVARDLATTISELEDLLASTKAIQADFLAGKLETGSSYLSFGIVIECGYDRTGPSPVYVEE